MTSMGRIAKIVAISVATAESTWPRSSCANRSAAINAPRGSGNRVISDWMAFRVGSLRTATGVSALTIRGPLCATRRSGPRLTAR